MKVLGVMLAITLLLAAIIGIGYGLIFSYGALTAQWQSINHEWQAVLMLIATMLILAIFFVTYVLARTIRREANHSVGRVDAYNAFVSWYSMLNANEAKIPEASSLAQTKNRIALWGSGRVVRQTNRLYEQLITGDAKNEVIAEKASHVYLEIKRELGYRNPGVDRSII